MKPQTFHHPVFGEVRALEVDGRPYFVGSDVAKALDYARPREAVSAHCKGAVSYRILTNGGEQETKIIPEGDVYRLIIKAAGQSRNPEIRARAEQFERWVFEEVLPSIRRTGAYAVRNLPAGQEDPIEKADRILALAHKYAGILHPKLSAAIQIRAYEALTGRPAYEQDPLWQTFCAFADANGLPRPGRDIGVWWDESVSKLDDITLIALKRTLTARNPRIRRMREAVEAELRRREKEGVDAGVGI